MAFIFAEFATASNVVVIFTALNAVLLVIFRINVKLGRFDWRLLVSIFGIPCIMYVAVASEGMLGSNGAW